MIKRNQSHHQRITRHRRVRGKVSGTSDRPRVVVFRSLRSLSLQAIDDVAGTTLAQANLGEIAKSKNTVAGARAVGKLLGERLVQLGKKSAVYDRAGYRYHGRVKEAAEGVREAGVTM